MKICYLCNLGFNAVRLQVDHFCNCGRHDVHVISTGSYTNCNKTDCKNIYQFNVKFPPDGRSLLDSFIMLIKIRKIIQKVNPDILHVYGVGVKGALAISFGFKGPIIGSTAGSDVLRRDRFPFYIRFLQKKFLKRVDLITMNGVDLKADLINLGVNSDKIVPIYFGINPSKFYRDPNIHELKKSLGLNGPVVTIVSQLIYPYGIDVFIKAIPLILQKIPETKFLVIGCGELEQQLKKLATDLKVQNNIIFTGKIDYEKMRDYYNITDVFVLTCTGCGGISIALMEAMTCELPVVVTDTGAYREVVKDGYNGYVVPIEDIEKFAERVVELLKDGELRRSFGKRGREIVEEKGDLAVNMKKMEKLYEKLVKR
jgi:glycosyltransferase involved in cell wall biosynthesis